MQEGMGIGDVSAVPPDSARAPFGVVRGRLGPMTTEFMEVWSLEEGDQILVNGNVYKIIDFSCNWSESDEYVFDVVDEEGFVHTISAEGSKKFRLVLDTTDAVV